MERVKNEIPKFLTNTEWIELKPPPVWIIHRVLKEFIRQSTGCGLENITLKFVCSTFHLRIIYILSNFPVPYLTRLVVASILHLHKYYPLNCTLCFLAMFFLRIAKQATSCRRVAKFLRNTRMGNISFSV